VWLRDWCLIMWYPSPSSPTSSPGEANKVWQTLTSCAAMGDGVKVCHGIV